MLLPLATQRLLLRRFTTLDLAAFQAYRGDHELARFQGWTPLSEAETTAFLADQSQQSLGEPGQWLQVAITLADGGQLIGDLGLCVAAGEAAERVLLGYTLSRPFQGRGYAAEAVRGAVRALSLRPQWASVEAITDARNAPSIALLQRLGFEFRGTIETVFRGEPCLEHAYQLTRQQWSQACSDQASDAERSLE